MLLWYCAADLPIQRSAQATERINGLTFVAPPEPFASDPMLAVTEVSADWIAAIPYAFTPLNQPVVRFGSRHQWWGERPEGIVETIRRAQAAGLKVMLKPQVWSGGWWTGDYHFGSNQDWLRWEAQYRQYILRYAHIADSLAVDMFCIGTEFKTSVEERPAFWLTLIDEVRSIYDGPLTYAANWDNFDNIPFWSKLDVIGVNAYFPLDSAQTPSPRRLIKCWKAHRDQIRACSRKHGKPVAFTEYGYLSVDGCADKTWELEASIARLDINQQAQANALEALYEVFYAEEYWMGGFLWKWFPNMRGHEGYPAKDYTPQGKLAEKVIHRYFSKSNQTALRR